MVSCLFTYPGSKIKKAMKKISLLVLFPALVIIFNFLEYGLIWDSQNKFIYPTALSAITVLNFFLPRIRRYSLLLTLSLFILMIAFYLANQIGLSGAVGSFGFALLITLVVSYLPIIFKRGYIEKL